MTGLEVEVEGRRWKLDSRGLKLELRGLREWEDDVGWREMVVRELRELFHLRLGYVKLS